MTRARSIKLGVFGASVAVLTLALTMSARGQQPPDPNGGFDPGQDAAAVSPSVDPPSRVARLSFAQGNVSVEPASVNEFSPAEVNAPLTTGDRVWTDNGAVAEIEAGQLAVRLGQATDLTVTAMTDTLAQFGMGQGSVHLRTYALDQGTTTELDTPNVAVTVLQPGDVRVDVDPNGESTVVTVLSGQVEVDGNGLQQTMSQGESVRLAGTDPVSAQLLQPPASDPLDTFSADRDQAYEAGAAAEQGDVNMDTVGAADLQQYGSWEPQSDSGPVWFPTVAVGWQPYCYGRWTWVAPWGWTWVESEPWGFAPFHYGRWAVFGGRWGWIPGPPVVHPVYAPALVVFVHPGNGVSAWFPLGPNEPYSPWYHSSTLYMNRVNVSNIYSRNFNQVRTVYNTPNRVVFSGALDSQRQFVNRGRATVAVPQQSLASGRPVRQALLHIPAEQLNAAAVVAHPMVTPERTMVAPTAARAVPPRAGRPMLTSHEDAAIRAGAGPRPQPATPLQPGAQPAPVERHGYPGGQGAQQGYRNAQSGATGTTQPVQPASNQPGSNQPGYRNNPGSSGQANQPNGYRNSNGATGTEPNPQPNPVYRNPNQPAVTQPNSQPSNGERIEGGVRPPNPARGTEQLPQQGAPAPRVQTAPSAEPADHGQQQLYNRAVPPPARPNFEQQRQAIQNTDPGRPLSPQQMDNLRANRPVGQPQMREAAPHPAPAPQQRSEPQRSSPPPPAAPHSENKK